MEITKNTNYNIQVQEMPELERIQIYHDKYPFLKLRKQISTFWEQLCLICKYMIFTNTFENLVLTVIIINSINSIVTPHTLEESTHIDEMELFFVIFYTSEMIIKIMGMGLYKKKDSYLSSVMNILDLVIVFSSLIPIMLTAFNISNNSTITLSL
jgi:hypothetical protein